MDGEHDPGDVAEEEHGHNAAENQGKVCLSSSSLPRSDVGVSAHIVDN